jgi:hypothetical protein
MRILVISLLVSFSLNSFAANSSPEDLKNFWNSFNQKEFKVVDCKGVWCKDELVALALENIRFYANVEWDGTSIAGSISPDFVSKNYHFSGPMNYIGLSARAIYGSDPDIPIGQSTYLIDENSASNVEKTAYITLCDLPDGQKLKCKKESYRMRKIELLNSNKSIIFSSSDIYTTTIILTGEVVEFRNGSIEVTATAE